MNISYVIILKNDIIWCDLERSVFLVKINFVKCNLISRISSFYIFISLVDVTIVINYVQNNFLSLYGFIWLKQIRSLLPAGSAIPEDSANLFYIAVHAFKYEMPARDYDGSFTKSSLLPIKFPSHETIGITYMYVFIVKKKRHTWEARN